LKCRDEGASPVTCGSVPVVADCVVIVEFADVDEDVVDEEDVANEVVVDDVVEDEDVADEEVVCVGQSFSECMQTP
jgi:hypothetical protein